jgi:hypothetical protein
MGEAPAKLTAPFLSFNKLGDANLEDTDYLCAAVQAVRVPIACLIQETNEPDPEEVPKMGYEVSDLQSVLY